MKEHEIELDDLHRRFDLIEKMLTESNQFLTERMSRGFLKAREDDVESPVGAACSQKVEIDYSEIKTVLEKERIAFKESLAKAIPNTLKQTLLRLKVFIWVIGLLLFLSSSANIWLFFNLRKEVIQRTPTRMQIEMMRRGWQQLQKEEKANVQ